MRLQLQLQLQAQGICNPRASTEMKTISAGPWTFMPNMGLYSQKKGNKETLISDFLLK
eukprot:CAMPEP_0171548596 /NCGR_PEP_ID=MMETSP0960-20121227/5929_1 /TAXON_ID=87120 /ORGANISM="Aurantiochytrium limacinum, Strain ATCCMYA-1381" /LENGTH=57 /DNA_ID=CAMNT_0012097103 /DNA_START=1084 /DNA_END=1254 /DNA_ORIENTATION=-